MSKTFGASSSLLFQLCGEEDEWYNDDNKEILDFLYLKDVDFLEDDEEPKPKQKPVYTQPKKLNYPELNDVINDVKEGECLVCNDTQNIIVANDECKHSFCNECLFDYLKIKITEFDIGRKVHSALEKEGKHWCLHIDTKYGVQCPAFNCKCMIEYEKIQQIVDNNLYNRFDQYALNKTIELDIKTVPRCKCGGWIQRNCLCSTKECRERTLRLLKRQEIKRRLEEQHHNEYGKLLKSIGSKCCPSCNTAIFKDGGCDHMYCTRCKLSFNWSQAPAFGTVNAHWWKEVRYTKNQLLEALENNINEF